MKWFEHKGEEQDIAVSTRIRLARNLGAYPFPGKCTDAQKDEVIRQAEAALGKSESLRKQFKLIRVSELHVSERQSLVERHLASMEFMQGGLGSALLLSQDEGVSIMLGEEDHIRLQVLGSGLCLLRCQADAEKLDALLEEELTYSFHEELGYLTKCPTNLGTGLRASVMLHLPLLTWTGRLGPLMETMSKLGLTVRGIYGEGSQARGNLYQLSNQVTLGLSEEEIIVRLERAVHQIIQMERQIRDEVYRKNPVSFADTIWRAAGLLQNARLMTTEEAEKNLSHLRVGLAMGILSGVEMEEVNRLMTQIYPGVLMGKEGENSSPELREEKRAAFLREALAGKIR